MNYAFGAFSRREAFELLDCPRCSQTHTLSLLVTVVKRQVRFGGPVAGQRHFDIEWTCPNTGEMFAFPVSVEQADDESVQAVAVDSEGAAVLPPPSWLEAARGDAQKESLIVARDFVATMLTTSLGAAPVYFAVVKYLTAKRVSPPVWLAIPPAVLFILAAALFALALRPQSFEEMDAEDFLDNQKRRVRILRRRTDLASVVFLAAVVSACSALSWTLTH
ncbi:hypothetical protein [Streptomyces sp. NPDC001404]|uniref:hypothetical protein n=1 Tax=Streptomyces sp. NPDC001404 TaxID=3364571 RepID=UPI003678E4A9